MSLDEELLRALNQGWASPPMDAVMVTLSIFGLTYIWLSIAVPLWLRNQKRTAVQLVILIIIIDIAVFVIKLLVARDRPEDIRLVVSLSAGYSFPSGHAARAFGAFLLLSFASKRRLVAVPLFLYALMIALSRIYLGAHYPSDVLGGAFAGLLFAFGVIMASKTVIFRNFIDKLITGVERLKESIKR